jgi:HlyD family secretion protein
MTSLSSDQTLEVEGPGNGGNPPTWLSRNRKRVWFGGVALLACGVAALAVALVAVGSNWLVSAAEGRKNGEQENQPSARPEEGAGEPVRVWVNTVHPQHKPSRIVSVQELAKVEAFFSADLRARVAGQVKTIYKDMNNRVHAGEVLVEIEAPELKADVERKAAEIVQREKEVSIAEEKAKVAKAAEDAAKETIELKNAARVEEQETRDLRKARYARYKRLYESGEKDGTKTITLEALEEVGRDYQVSLAACARAEADVRKATAEWRQMQVTSAAALVDIEHARAMVEEARKERDYAQALADLALIRAPFDGVIVERNVDPGSFVHNSTTAGGGDPLVTVARTDILTVSMKVPDNFAPFVSLDTGAVLQLDQLPGVVLHGKVTRFAPAIDQKDRSMLVEVDLFNGGPNKYHRFLAKCLADHLAPLASASPLESAVAAAAGNEVWSHNRKGVDDPLPLVPRITGRAEADQPLPVLPGMSGQMRLLLKRFQNVYLLPTSAVFSRGGKRYIAEVVEGKVHFVPVRVQVDDGKWVKLSLIRRPADDPNEDEVLTELAGSEEVITGGQGELEEGQPVHAFLESP